MPNSPRYVVTNTTPLIALDLIGKLHLLHDLYDEVLMPPAVYAEALAGGEKRVGAIGGLQSTPWLRVHPLSDPRRANLLVDLDRGEAEAIALAQELDADLLIIDERLGRLHARRLGIAITGTIGVLLKAKVLGYVYEVRPLLEQLHKGGIYLSDELVRRALDLAGEK